MGFLKFLTKSKEKEAFKFPSKEELDIPPAPALKVEEKEEAPTFPAVEEEEGRDGLFEQDGPPLIEVETHRLRRLAAEWYYSLLVSLASHPHESPFEIYLLDV